MNGKQLINLFKHELRAGGSRKSVMLMIAGPNGAGKSTLWERLLNGLFAPGTIEYINADDIQRELNPDGPHARATEETSRQAQREAAWRREALLRRAPQQQSHFAYETVFSDPHGHKLAELQRGRAAGYFVVMTFVGIEAIELSMQRVATRVSEGGHDVPPDKQRTRFERVYANAQRALDIVDLALFLDNSRDASLGAGTHRPIAVCRTGEVLGCSPELPAWWRRLDTDSRSRD